MDEQKTLASVEEYYGKVLATSKDLKTSACTAAKRPHRLIIDAMRKIPDEVMAKFYGCGNPIPFGIDGLTVLDLGSGSGRDCYLASKLVGEKGKGGFLNDVQKGFRTPNADTRFRENAGKWCTKW